MECSIEDNKLSCSCTKTTCKRRGKCCECVSYHREHGEIPGCFFSAYGEATYDRSVKNFVNTILKKI